MTTSTLRSVLLWLVPTMLWCATGAGLLPRGSAPAAQQSVGEEAGGEKALQVHYLEIVTPDMDAACSALEKIHGVRFSEPDAELGNARTAALVNGWRIGVRAPMHDAEEPVVRPYMLVDDIDAAAEAATAAGAEFMVPPTEGSGGKYALFALDGVQHALWQN